MNSYDQYIYKTNDIDKTMPASRDHTVAIIAALVAIEAEHPGILLYVLRTAALANAGFRLTANCSNSKASMEAQNELSEWIRWFEDNNRQTKEVENES